jgi:transcriptional regulator GlxA family with amidase domain
MAVDIFRKMFPKVDLVPDKIITDEQRLFCAGGSTSFFNLVIYLVEKYCGHDIAVLLSKSMLIDMDKAPQSAYAIFSGQKEHGLDDILKVQSFIEENVNSSIKIDDLVKLTALSRRSFIRKFKGATGNTPKDYIQRVKVEWARKKLEYENIDIQQISYFLSYKDSGTFSKIFKKHIGISPNAYRNKFKKMIPD